MHRIRQLLKLPVLAAVTIGVVLLQNFLLPDEPVNPTSVAVQTPTPEPTPSPSPGPSGAPAVAPSQPDQTAPATTGTGTVQGAVPPTSTVPGVQPPPIVVEPPPVIPPLVPLPLPGLVQCDGGLVGGLLRLGGVCSN